VQKSARSSGIRGDQQRLGVGLAIDVQEMTLPVDLGDELG
jgi:hypothetical protein